MNTYTALLLCLLVFPPSIYDFDITDINGNTIHLSDFNGKKILFVNTATNSSYAQQYGSLEQLYQLYKDSLAIIAIPSNSFGNEPNENDSILNFVQAHYDIHYILASKINVTGDSIAPLYQWLTQSSGNGAFDNPVHSDFYKYLVNREGELIAVSAGMTDPMDTVIQNLIQTQ